MSATCICTSVINKVNSLVASAYSQSVSTSTIELHLLEEGTSQHLCDHGRCQAECPGAVSGWARQGTHPPLWWMSMPASWIWTRNCSSTCISSCNKHCLAVNYRLLVHLCFYQPEGCSPARIACIFTVEKQADLLHCMSAEPAFQLMQVADLT